jgi:hypothetical protein
MNTTVLIRRGAKPLGPAAVRSGVAAALLLLAAAAPAPGQGGNPNPGVAPPNSQPHGKTYGEWGAEWSQWLVGIPAAMNPALDATGEFGDVDQSGPVWFLAGTLSGSAERTLTVPAGKALFFPLVSYLSWDTDDLEAAKDLAESLGLDPDDLTTEELIRLYANANVDPGAELTLVIDGVALRDLRQYRADSPSFDILDTDLIDDFGLPISQPNLAVAAGYWIMLAPLPAGRHTIHFIAEEFDGSIVVDVTYHLTVGP